MNNMILHSLLYKTFILLTVLNLIKGDKFIGKYLYSKVKNHLVSTSHGTNHKLWMEYLEKRLETISMFASIQLFKKRQSFSVVQYYKRNVEKKIFEESTFIMYKAIHRASKLTLLDQFVVQQRMALVSLHLMKHVAMSKVFSTE